METLMEIPVSKIDSVPEYQVRVRWDAASDTHIATLAASMAGAEGLIHPIVVVPLPHTTTFGRAFALIAGQRRLAAARHLSWDTILARVLPACDLDDPATRLRLLAMALRENTEREALHPEDRRNALQRLRALYTAIHPPTVRSRPRTHPPAEQEAPGTSFARWAAQMTALPEYTIRRDIRMAVVGGPNAPLPLGHTLPGAEAPMAVHLQYAMRRGQEWTTVLRGLRAILTAGAEPLPAAAPERLALRQRLEELTTEATALLQALEE